MNKKLILLLCIFPVLFFGCSKGADQSDLPALINSEEAMKEVSGIINEKNAEEEAEKLLKEIDSDLE